jgi:hypothetical protein
MLDNHVQQAVSGHAMNFADSDRWSDVSLRLIDRATAPSLTASKNDDFGRDTSPPIALLAANQYALPAQPLNRYR